MLTADRLKRFIIWCSPEIDAEGTAISRRRSPLDCIDRICLNNLLVVGVGDHAHSLSIGINEVGVDLEAGSEPGLEQEGEVDRV